MFIIALLFALLLQRRTGSAVELCPLLNAETVRLQGFFLVGNRLQLIISSEVYSTEVNKIDNSEMHLNLVGGKSHGSFQSYGWTAIAASTFAGTNLELVAAFELPYGSNSNLSFGHLIVRQAGKQELDHRLVDIDQKMIASSRLGGILANGVYGLVANANRSILFRARDYGAQRKVVVFRQGPLINASGYSEHLPVKKNEKAIAPFFYLLKDSQNGQLKVTEKEDQTQGNFTVPSFDSLPLFGFIHQEMAHVIDAATRTVILLPLSAIDLRTSNRNGSSVLREVKFEQYFVCLSAVIQSGPTAILLVVVGLGVVLVAAVALFSIGRRHPQRRDQEKSSLSTNSSTSVSETNQHRLEVMVAKMGVSIKSRPCFNPAKYKVREAKKRRAKKKMSGGGVLKIK